MGLGVEVEVGVILWALDLDLDLDLGRMDPKGSDPGTGVESRID